jgi:hypothetical protein
MMMMKNCLTSCSNGHPVFFTAGEQVIESLALSFATVEGLGFFDKAAW